MLFKEFNFDTNVSKIFKKPSKVRCSGKEQIISSWFFCERNRLLCKSIALAIPVYYFFSGKLTIECKSRFHFPWRLFLFIFLKFFFCLFSLLRDFDTTVQLASQSQVNCPFNFFVDPPIFSFLFSFLFCAFNNLKLSDLMPPVSTRFYSSSSKRSNNYLFSLCITNKVWNLFFQLFLSSAFFFGWFESPQLCSARTQIYLDCEKTEKTFHFHLIPLDPLTKTFR